MADLAKMGAKRSKVAKPAESGGQRPEGRRGTSCALSGDEARCKKKQRREEENEEENEGKGTDSRGVDTQRQEVRLSTTMLRHFRSVNRKEHGESSEGEIPGP